MNYAQAVTGRLTRVGALGFIQSQAQTELRRLLTHDEISLLSTQLSAVHFVRMIQKVFVFYELISLLHIF